MRSSTPHSSRRGATLILVIVCLAVMTIVLGSLLKMSLSERKQSRAEERELRASWLAESGLERAWARLSESADYAGETWAISAETLHGDRAAEVTIVVETPPDAPNRRRIRSRAVFPSTGTLRSTQTRLIDIMLPVPASDPGENR